MDSTRPAIDERATNLTSPTAAKTKNQSQNMPNPQTANSDGKNHDAATQTAPAPCGQVISPMEKFSDWFLESIALPFFFKQDKVAERVLTAILTADIVPTWTIPDEEVIIPTLSPNSSEDKQFEVISSAIFKTDPSDGTKRYMAANLHSVCELAKNRARQQRHAHIRITVRKKLRGELEKAIQEQAQITPNGMEGLAAVSFRQLRDFGQKYRSILGARPFLKGLRHLLQRQLEEENLVCWHVHEVTFTEVSDHFLRDAIQLLVKTLALGSHFDSEVADALYNWTLPEWTNDRLLHQLLANLPPEDKGVKASGSITVTDIPRLNGPEGNVGFFARFCFIL